VHRSPRFEFLEPVTIELKLKNITASPMVVDAKLLESDELALVVARRGGEPRAIRPYSRRCYLPESRVLMPGESIYASAYVASDVYGSAIDQPGDYQIYAMLDLDEVEILAAPLAVQVMPPVSRDAERIAPDVLSDEVGRTLAFGGTRVMTGANDILADAAERLPGTRIAMHAEAALGQVASRPGKIVEQDSDGDKKVRVQAADVGEALEQLGSAYADMDAAADTFGHIEVTERVVKYAETVKASGDAPEAGAIASNLADTLEARGVKPAVVEATREKAAELRR
jgi:hypothetical protein